MDPVPAVLSIVVLGIIAAIVYYLFVAQHHRAGVPVGGNVRPPAKSDVLYAPETKATLMGHRIDNWELPVEGLYAQPYEPITFRPPNPNGWLDNYGVQNFILWDLSKTGEDCGPDIMNPPFHKSNDLCWYVRSWAEATPPQV